MPLEHLLTRHKLMLLALAVIAVVFSLYWPTFSRIVEMWSIEAYQYGWLVYPVSLYVLFTKRDVLALTQWRTSASGASLAALLVLVWLVARGVGIQIVEFISATLLVIASYWALAGTYAMRKVAFPLLLLVTAVPMGHFLVEPLMTITAEIASALLKLIGMPALRDGQFFFLPGGSFEVADVCSGLRFLLAGTMVSLAYSYLAYSSNVKRLVFIGFAAIVLVITNGVRAFIVMSVASATDMKVLGGYDHVVFGMVLFALVFVALILVGDRFSDPKNDSGQADFGRRSVPGDSASGVVFVITLVIVIAGPVFGAAMINRGASAIAELPLPVLDGCVESGDWMSDGAPEFLQADYERRGLFSCADYQTGVYVASYGEQQQGKELINWANRVWPNEWRRYAHRSTISIPTSGGDTSVQQVLVRHPEGWRLIWYWYQVGSSVTSSQNTVKLLEALRALRLHPVESSIIVVTVISSNEDNAAELREQIETHADRVMIWNLERVELGTRQ